MNAIFVGCMTITMTERCNICCEHCLRGDAGNKAISNETLKRVISFINSNNINVGVITPTGGEPLLEQEKIIKLHNETEISLAIKTNGTIFPETELLMILPKYDSQIIVSNSEFHEHERMRYKELKNSNTLFADVVRAKMFRDDFICIESSKYTYINTGRAYENGIGERISESSFYDEDNNEIDCLHIGVNGNVYNNCNISYEDENEDSEYYLGNVFDIPKLIKNIREKKQ
jgi:organic radical activating enzyme